MLSPIRTMFMHFPGRAYGTVLVLLLVSLYALWQIRRRYRSGILERWWGMTGWVLLNYLLLLLFLAVLGRRSMDYDRYNFEVFYSYRDVLTTGDPGVALQIAANIAVFVPVGALGSLIAKRRNFLKGLLLGVGLSVCIELLQLIMRNGTCETDDLISNTLGTLMGCILAVTISHCVRPAKAMPSSASSAKEQ